MLTVDWDWQKREAERERQLHEQKCQRIETIRDGLSNLVYIVRQGEGERKWTHSEEDMAEHIKHFLQTKGIWLYI
jgi:hypothetical protein